MHALPKISKAPNVIVKSYNFCLISPDQERKEMGIKGRGDESWRKLFPAAY